MDADGSVPDFTAALKIAKLFLGDFPILKATVTFSIGVLTSFSVLLPTRESARPASARELLLQVGNCAANFHVFFCKWICCYFIANLTLSVSGCRKVVFKLTPQQNGA